MFIVFISIIIKCASLKWQTKELKYIVRRLYSSNNITTAEVGKNKNMTDRNEIKL